MSDAGIRATNNDASHCKRWCVEKGYFKDDYLRYFVHSTTPKTPEISRGYYVRVEAVRQAVRGFLRTHGPDQCTVISLGAGSDTLFWNLSQEGLTPRAYVEIDFPQIVMKKIRTIAAKPELYDVISRDPAGGSRDQSTGSRDTNCEVTKGSIHSSRYHLISADLREKKKLSEVPESRGLDTSLPTLVLTECVLCYLPPASSTDLITWTSTTFPNSCFLNYEPCNMADRFGGIMIDNMRSRDCELPGILACPTLADQHTRFINAGFTSAKAIDMNEAMRLLPAEDIQRMIKLEFFDEQEILTQLLEHYCLAWGFQGNVNHISLST